MALDEKKLESAIIANLEKEYPGIFNAEISADGNHNEALKRLIKLIAKVALPIVEHIKNDSSVKTPHGPGKIS